jgi:hypothetical protein
MDIISGLGSLGIYFNNHEDEIKYTKYDNALKRTPINGINIYDNTNYVENKNYYDDLAYNRYQEAVDPKKSGIIPNFYNQFQAVAKRNEEYRQERLKKEIKQNKFILSEQKANVTNRNLIYKQVLYGMVLMILLLVFVQLTMEN